MCASLEQRWSITVHGAALSASKNPRCAHCDSIRRQRTCPAEVASELCTKQPDSLASSASTSHNTHTHTVHTDSTYSYILYLSLYYSYD